MTIKILNRNTREEKVSYENVINFYVEPAPRITTLGISLADEDVLETISNDECMLVE